MSLCSTCSLCQLKGEVSNIKCQLEKLHEGKVDKADFEKAKLLQKELQDSVKKLSFAIDKLSPIVSLSGWVDPKGVYYDKFQFKGRTMITKTLADVFGKNKIFGQYSFTATFLKVGGTVGLGISDASNKTLAGDWNTNFVYFYNDSKCNVGHQFTENGLEFKEGEKVKVIVDLNSGIIQWRVGYDIRHQLIHPMLKNCKVTWVPIVNVRTPGDVVEIEEC